MEAPFPTCRTSVAHQCASCINWSFVLLCIGITFVGDSSFVADERVCCTRPTVQETSVWMGGGSIFSSSCWSAFFASVRTLFLSGFFSVWITFSKRSIPSWSTVRLRLMASFPRITHDIFRKSRENHAPRILSVGPFRVNSPILYITVLIPSRAPEITTDSAFHIRARTSLASFIACARLLAQARLDATFASPIPASTFAWL